MVIEIEIVLAARNIQHGLRLRGLRNRNPWGALVGIFTANPQTQPSPGGLKQTSVRRLTVDNDGALGTRLTSGCLSITGALPFE